MCCQTFIFLKKILSNQGHPGHYSFGGGCRPEGGPLLLLGVQGRREGPAGPGRGGLWPARHVGGRPLASGGHNQESGAAAGVRNVSENTFWFFIQLLVPAVGVGVVAVAVAVAASAIFASVVAVNVVVAAAVVVAVVIAL